MYANNPIQDKYKSLIDDMNEISKYVGYDVLVCNNDDILPVKDITDADLQRIVIFDDFVCENNQKPLIDYYFSHGIRIAV